jgi:hypothetical protein
MAHSLFSPKFLLTSLFQRGGLTLKLAWREYRLPFSLQTWKSGCPGGCDFRWLTFLLAGVLCMALLLLGTREGLMNRFVETLLGKVPHSGVPIWIVPTTGRRLDGPVLSHIQNQIAPVFPYRDIPPEKIRLPGHPGYDNDKPVFPGRAVSFFDPLWKLPTRSPPQPETCFPQPPSDGTDKLPLEVTLNKSWFLNQFDYSAYRKALASQLPAPCLKELPSAETTNPVDLLQVLWLDIDLKEHELVPFKIRWAEQIPAMEKLAFLLPMTTYHLVWIAKDLSELRYYPEMQGGDGVRVGEIFLPDAYLEKNVEKQLDGLITCTNGTRQDDVIQFPKYLPVYWIQACANAHNLPYTEDWNKEAYSGDKIRHDKPWALFLPCHRLDEAYKRMLSHQATDACAQNPYNNVPLNMLREDFMLSRALVYAKDYTKLSEIKDKLLQLKVRDKQALYLHDIYKKSIDRFDFLADSLETLQGPYALIFGAFLLLLLWVNLGTLIDHRQHRYGILLAKGMPEMQIRNMVYFQVFLATLVGMILALAAFWVVKEAINYWFSVFVLEAHRDNLDILGTLDLLPLNWLHIVGVWMVGLVITVVVAAIHLYFMPLRRDTAPSELLQS